MNDLFKDDKGNYGRASAVYFTADQVEANEERG